MQTASTIELNVSIEDLPHSKIVYPDAPVDWLKYAFWRFYTPLHPHVRDAVLKAGLMKHDIRQDFILGKIAPGRSVSEIVSFLISKGYGNHFIAWRDAGEIVGLRYVVDFARQYHIRIFNDGEVRGHYEYTPECYPILHMKRIGMEDRRMYFLELLKGLIV